MRRSFAAACCALWIAFAAVAPRPARAADPEDEPAGVAPPVACVTGERRVCFTCTEAREVQAALDECAADVALYIPPPCEHEDEVRTWVAVALAGAGIIAGLLVGALALDAGR